MKWLFLAVVAAAVFVAALAALALARKRKGAGADDAPWPFYARRVMTAPEQALYWRLRSALPQHAVLAQVGLSRMLGVRKGHNFGHWFNRINRMSADFVLCAKDASVVAVIELDDASHRRADRQAADAKKDRALQSAGIRVVRWQATAIPDEATIQATLAAQQPSLRVSQAEPARPATRRRSSKAAAPQAHEPVLPQGYAQCAHDHPHVEPAARADRAPFRHPG